jgi:asparagine synthase (glutamine-hydrolysing)
LDERSLQRQTLLDPAQIRRKRIEHQSGGRNWQRPLWVVLMLQAWLARWFGEAA